MSEVGTIIDTDPDVAQWAWYSGAYHQYHSSLTLLIDLYQNPDLPESGRIMAVLDHVFGQSSAPTPQLRCAQILRAIKDNMSSFLTAIGSADPQSTLYNRSVPHPTLMDGDHGFPTSFPDTFESPDAFEPTMSDSDVWWLWQPELQYYDESGSGDFPVLESQ